MDEPPHPSRSDSPSALSRQSTLSPETRQDAEDTEAHQPMQEQLTAQSSLVGKPHEAEQSAPGSGSETAQEAHAASLQSGSPSRSSSPASEGDNETHPSRSQASRSPDQSARRLPSRSPNRSPSRSQSRSPSRSPSRSSSRSPSPGAGCTCISLVKLTRFHQIVAVVSGWFKLRTHLWHAASLQSGC